MRIASITKTKRALTSLFFLGALVLSTIAPLAPTTVSAAPGAGDCSRGSFLSFPRWYDGLCENGKIKPLSGGVNASGTNADNATAKGSLGGMIWGIALNIIAMMLHLVGYVSLGFVIWGGIKFIISGDNASGVASARKTILNAIIGLILSIMAVAIVNVVAGAFK